MTNIEIATANLRQYKMAEYKFFAGNGLKPNPVFYGYSGGNTINVNGETFHTDEIEGQYDYTQGGLAYI